MVRPFDSFILFAEMRTGSNFLENNLNAFPGISCHGEAFNPHFVGYPNKDELFGINLKTRESDPLRLLTAIRENGDAINGFRYFHDHDNRVFLPCMEDKRCAKVILSRNPVDSYVSWKIAQQTGQWKLTNVSHKRSAKISFDVAEFDAMLAAQCSFRESVQNKLQTSGQGAFFLSYEDLQDVDVINGLAQFLGDSSRIDKLSKSLKKQNPTALKDKVLNYDEMESALSRADHFNLSVLPNFEPPRGPNVPSYIAAVGAPLLYLPIRGRADTVMEQWLAAFGEEDASVLTGFNQKLLRQWKRKNTGHRSFTIISHPASRAHNAFCRHILWPGPDCFAEIRGTLRQKFDHPLPAAKPGKGWDKVQHRAAFLAFLEFLKDNLAQQTAIRIDPAWASQSQLLQGMSRIASPDMIIREESLHAQLAILTDQIGVTMPKLPEIAPDTPFTLADFYDGEIETAIRAVYQRDYMSFGFGRWKDQAA